MANTIRLKRSSVPGKVPTTADLALGELGLNFADAKLYAKKSVGGVESIVEIGASSGGGGGGSVGPIAESAYLITQSYQLTANTNGLSLSPVTIDAGVTVTIPENATWMVMV